MKRIVPLLLFASISLSSCVVVEPPPPPPRTTTWRAPTTTTKKTTSTASTSSSQSESRPGRRVGGRFIEDVPPEDVEPVQTVIKVQN